MSIVCINDCIWALSQFLNNKFSVPKLMPLLRQRSFHDPHSLQEKDKLSLMDLFLLKVQVISKSRNIDHEYLQQLWLDLLLQACLAKHLKMDRDVLNILEAFLININNRFFYNLPSLLKNYRRRSTLTFVPGNSSVSVKDFW